MGTRGFEPPRVAPLGPQPSAFASFATSPGRPAPSKAGCVSLLPLMSYVRFVSTASVQCWVRGSIRRGNPGFPSYRSTIPPVTGLPGLPFLYERCLKPTDSLRVVECRTLVDGFGEPVTAPSEAEETIWAYLAITP